MGAVLSSAPEGHRAASEARDRRRVRRLAWGSAILFLVPAAYALLHSEPTPYRSQGSYALLASAATLPTSTYDAVSPVALPAAKAVSVKPEARTAPSAAPFRVKHDQYYCGFYAQAVTGNTTPEQASRRRQTNGAIMGALSGAFLGALFGGAGGHSGRSATLGAGAGLLAGVAMGSGSGQRAADELRSRYDWAYASCMRQKDDDVTDVKP